jgi:hypothetical protein
LNPSTFALSGLSKRCLFSRGSLRSPWQLTCGPTDRRWIMRSPWIGRDRNALYRTPRACEAVALAFGIGFGRAAAALGVRSGTGELFRRRRRDGLPLGRGRKLGPHAGLRACAVAPRDAAWRIAQLLAVLASPARAADGGDVRGRTPTSHAASKRDAAGCDCRGVLRRESQRIASTERRPAGGLRRSVPPIQPAPIPCADTMA